MVSLQAFSFFVVPPTTPTHQSATDNPRVEDVTEQYPEESSTLKTRDFKQITQDGLSYISSRLAAVAHKICAFLKNILSFIWPSAKENTNSAKSGRGFLERVRNRHLGIKEIEQPATRAFGIPKYMMEKRELISKENRLALDSNWMKSLAIFANTYPLISAFNPSAATAMFYHRTIKGTIDKITSSLTGNLSYSPSKIWSNRQEAAARFQHEQTCQRLGEASQIAIYFMTPNPLLAKEINHVAQSAMLLAANFPEIQEYIPGASYVSSAIQSVEEKFTLARTAVKDNVVRPLVTKYVTPKLFDAAIALFNSERGFKILGKLKAFVAQNEELINTTWQNDLKKWEDENQPVLDEQRKLRDAAKMQNDQVNSEMMELINNQIANSSNEREKQLLSILLQIIPRLQHTNSPNERCTTAYPSKLDASETLNTVKDIIWLAELAIQGNQMLNDPNSRAAGFARTLIDYHVTPRAEELALKVVDKTEDLIARMTIALVIYKVKSVAWNCFTAHLAKSAPQTASTALSVMQVANTVLNGVMMIAGGGAEQSLGEISVRVLGVGVMLQTGSVFAGTVLIYACFAAAYGIELRQRHLQLNGIEDPILTYIEEPVKSVSESLTHTASEFKTSFNDYSQFYAMQRKMNERKSNPLRSVRLEKRETSGAGRE